MVPPSQHHPEESSGKMEWSRRSFMKLAAMGALSTAWSLSSCRSAGRYTVPYDRMPEWMIPGTGTLYSTFWPGPWGALPLIAVSHDGRPTMLEPNHEHPEAAGCPTHAMASLWDLYSPDRSKQLLYKGNPVTEGQAMGPAEFAAAFRKWSRLIKKGASAAIIVEDDSSPTLQALVSRLKSRNPAVRLYLDDSFRSINNRKALESHYKHPVRCKIHFEKASRILAIESDFVGIDPYGEAKGFFDKRSPEHPEGMNRLYVVESVMTLTGGMADERLPINPSSIKILIPKLAQAINKRANHPSLQKLCRLLDVPSKNEDTHLAGWIDACAEDLVNQKGKSLILAGSHLEKEIHEIVFILNDALQAATPSGIIEAFPHSLIAAKGLSELIKDIEKEEIDFLFWLSPGNPLLSKHGECRAWEMALSSVESIHLGLYPDSLAKASTWHIPMTHFLEAWGDTRYPNGTSGYQQPLIFPLFGGTSPLELIMGLLSDKGRLANTQTTPGNLSPAYSAVKATFMKSIQATDKEFAWNEALKKGYSIPPVPPIPLSAPVPADEKVQELADYLADGHSERIKTPVSLLKIPDYSLLDGRYINNAWLQECPDPVSKIVWGNAALASPDFPACEEKKKISRKEFLRISWKNDDGTDREYLLPLIRIPGMDSGVVAIPAGYGQEVTGLVGENTGFAFPDFADGTSLNFEIMEESNPDLLPAQSQREQILANPALIPETAPGKPIPFPTGQDPIHQWGMCIDLSKCTGCQACVLACQAENNIPIVGREEASRNRLMHWLHVDRYFKTEDPVSAGMVFQPRACQQCENAPCESVCPVNATVHTKDGLNAMAYPRCVGTRYCASNCPYKVRRFNYFDFNKYNPYIPGNLRKGPLGEPMEGTSPRWQKNPNVTVRIRGIMEKCTYCVQRIEAAKNRRKALVKQKAVRAGKSSIEITLTEQDQRIPCDSFQCACQAACPAGAITFGNLLDGDKSAVVRARQSPRAYTLLDQLNVLPRTSYLLPVKNRNRESSETAS